MKTIGPINWLRIEKKVGFHLREQGIRNERGKVVKLVQRDEVFLEGHVWWFVGRKENVGDICYMSQQTCIQGAGVYFTLREVLTKRHCVLKEVSRVRTEGEGTKSQSDKLWIARLTL